MNKALAALASLLFSLLIPFVSFAQIPVSYQQNLVDYRAVEIDVEELKRELEDAPMKGVASINRNSSTIITLPLPNGENQQFKVVESPILSPSLSAQRPNFKSYIAQGIDDPTATARFNITPMGFYGLVSGINGLAHIELQTIPN